ncbi:hypothetical protein HY68_15895 [Streptomyces sp. AcH 505]|uniref:DUF3311 domain-containing protein n=1 Tax=unclassified Streptomyces TaxID=2593676 RepID=UPI0005923F92|nr:DUF3311 domain-containing protein [Streptomyces sp. NBC_00370]KIF69729.1 hypothetical protein HY68_15895 [Streptomyces sp. AcH 505]
MFLQRPHLLWLLVPFVLFLVAVPWVNRVDPVIAGVPFLPFWLFVSTLLTPFAVWRAYRGDQRLIEQREHQHRHQPQSPEDGE